MKRELQALQIDGSTRLFGIVGSPVTQVKTPQLMNALFDASGIRYERIFEPTVALSRRIFCAPTQYYKTGVVFLAYLNGFQPHFFMLGGHHGARPPLYLADVFRLADAARLLRDPALAVQRMRLVMQTLGL
ncbi:DUF993 family protein [Paraburkholderia kirstenboschensis]|uniref:DUF993 family protein n=1 Tax=Paraburkholderia kirstenboschensis TaxID=1245436 RepID=UPI003741ED0C